MPDISLGVRLTGDGSQLVGQLKEVAAAQDGVSKEAKAMAAAYVAADAAINDLARAQAQAKAEIDAAKASLKSGTIAQEEYNRTVLQTRAALSGIEATHRQSINTLNKSMGATNGATESIGAMRAASANLGFQIQDITQGLAMGVNPMIVFGQQAGQVASALSGLGGTAGKVGTFLAGPWGSLILAGVTVVGMFAAELLNSGDAAEDAAKEYDNAASAARELVGAMNAVALAKRQIKLNESRSEALTIENRMATRPKNPDGTPMFSYKDNQRLQELRWQITEEENITKVAERQNADLDRKAREAEERRAKAKEKRGAKGGAKKSSVDADVKRAAAEAVKLGNFAEGALESITRITEEFDAQPKLVDRVNQSIRNLDKIIGDLNTKQPKGFQAMIAEAERAKGVVSAALLKPFNDYMEAASRAREQQELILAGREDEAEALKDIYRLQDQVGEVTEAQRAAILKNADAEKRVNELLAERAEIVSAYQESINGVRSSIEGLLSGSMKGGDFLKSLKANFKQLQGKLLTEAIFGPALRDLDKYVRENTGISSGVDLMEVGVKKAAEAATGFAGVLTDAAKQVAGAFGGSVSAASPTGGGIASSVPADVQNMFDFILSGRTIGWDGQVNPAGTMSAAGTGSKDGEDIVVTGDRTRESVMMQTPDEYFRRLGGVFSTGLGALLKRLAGVDMPAGLNKVLGGALGGYASGGIPGALIGAAKEIKGLPEKLGGKLDKMGKGAETGTIVAGIGKALGAKMSTTGSQTGGAIGSLSGIPGGDIIGSIIGGLIGGALKKTKKAMATITGGASGFTTEITGNSSSRKSAAGDMAGSLLDAMDSIASALGGSVNSTKGSVSVGVRGKKYRVDPTGGGNTKVSKGAVDFGKDGAEAAIAFAAVDLLKDGVIEGLSAAVTKALQSSDSLDKALAEAVKTKELEVALGGFNGAALDAFRTFEAQAKDRLRIAKAYGLELNKVEELNAKDRIKVREQLEQEAFGSLQSLLDSMRFGSMFEGSAVDQRNAILAEIEKAKVSAAAGDAGASDKLAGLLSQLNDVSTDVFGTTGGYAADRAGIVSVAENVISILRTQLDDAQSQATAAQVDTTNALLDEANDQSAAMLAELKRIADMISASGGSTAGMPMDALAALAYTGGASGAA